MTQLLRFSLKPPQRDSGTPPYEYMCTKFIDEVRECLSNGGALKIVDDIEEIEDSQFLVAYEERIFVVDTDFQVGEYFTDYAACGLARDFALGSFYSTESGTLPPRGRVGMALRSAEEFSSTVRSPFIIKQLKY